MYFNWIVNSVYIRNNVELAETGKIEDWYNIKWKIKRDS